MARVRLLRSKPKIDEAEWALTESRTAVRLAGLFDPAVDEDPSDSELDAAGAADPPTGAAEASPGVPVEAELPRPAPAAVDPIRPPDGQRPPIIVIGVDDRTASAPAPEPVVGIGREPVPVMAEDLDDRGRDSWLFDVADELASVPAVLARNGTPRPAKTRGKAPAAAVVASAFCPYCGVLLDPPPSASRRCTSCLQRIVVKRMDGRPVYLAEAAVLVFDAERRRQGSASRLTRQRQAWLRLAAGVGAPAGRVTRLAAARISQDAVDASRALYLAAADRALRAARRQRDWEGAARIRRDEARALYRAAGAPQPIPSEMLALFGEGAAAELRGIAEISRDAELISAGCCDACRADDQRIFRISQLLRVPRLPHAGCPRGLCRCHFDLAERDRSTLRRYLRRRSGAEARISPPEQARRS